MLNIQIGENYLITSDSMNVILNQRYTKENGETDFKAVGFYPTVEAAANGLMRKEISIGDAENLGELVKLIIDTKQQILTVLKQKQISELQQQIREQNTKLNGIKALIRNKETVESWEVFEIMEPKVEESDLDA